jgi:hypothetical protein
VIPPNPPVLRKFLFRARQSAFSLVEVVLAVGVISFAFVAILGLLPAGLAQFRQAMDNSVGTQIAQRIILECQQTDFDVLFGDTLVNGKLVNLATTYPNAQQAYYGQLASYATNDKNKANPLSVRYFDEQGNEVIAQGASGALSNAELATVIYHVNTRIGYPTPLAEANGGKDSTSSPAGFSTAIVTVVVQVAFNPSGKTLPVNANMLFDVTKLPAGTVKTYCAQVGRND